MAALTERFGPIATVALTDDPWSLDRLRYEVLGTAAKRNNLPQPASSRVVFAPDSDIIEAGDKPPLDYVNVSKWEVLGFAGEIEGVLSRLSIAQRRVVDQSDAVTADRECGSSIAPNSIPELAASDDCNREIRTRGVSPCARHGVDEPPVGPPDGASERVADHLLRERGHDLLLVLLQVGQEALGADDRRLVCEFTGDVDGLAVGVRPADAADRGVRRRYYRQTSTAGWSSVAVPHAWNVGDHTVASMNGSVGWYRKDFELPDTSAALDWAVRFESVNYRARVWLNGREVGSHAGAYLPFTVPLDRLRRINRLVVRVDSRRDDVPLLHHRSPLTYITGHLSHHQITLHADAARPRRPTWTLRHRSACQNATRRPRQ